MQRRLFGVGTRRWGAWRIAGWGFAVLLLLVPLAAMRVTDEVNWTAGDFIFAAVLLGSVGVAFEWAVRRSCNRAFRTGMALALAAASLTLWSNGAVGLIGEEDEPLNLVFVGVPVLALLGSVLAHFRAKGMALTMRVAAVVHLLGSALGLLIDVRGGILSAVLAVAWLLSARSFGKAATDHDQTEPEPPYRT